MAGKIEKAPAHSLVFKESGTAASHTVPAAAPSKYIGSIRFFKNLIFLSICVLIAVPCSLAVKYYRIASAPQEPVSDAAPVVPPAAEPTAPDAETGSKDTADAASEEPPAYQSLYPDFHAPQPYGATERIEKVVYLTFSDGPSERTDEILAILAEKDVKATFFVVGCNEEGDEQRLRNIAAQGHTIGMHSYTHDYAAIYASMESFLGDFYQNFQEILNATGVAPTVFRLPGGSINIYNAAVYRKLIGEMVRRDFVPFDANVSTEDVDSQNTAEKLVENVLRDMSGLTRGVVQLHDSVSKTSTVEALPTIIDRLREQGYSFMAITPETMPVLFVSG